MTSATSNPWEVPPDESYWNGLLSDVEERALPPETRRTSQPGGADAALDRPVLDSRPRQDGIADEGFYGPDTDEPPSTSSLSSNWQQATSLFESKDRVELEVIGYNRGGLLVQFGQIQGFVPASQLVELPRELNSQARQAELARHVGDRLCLQVIEIDRSRNRLIFSERAATHDPEVNDILKSLSEGDVCRGRVTSLCGFGAFVDLGGVEGLIHISELSWGRVNHPMDVVRPGDEIEVYVMGIEAEQQRVALSLKRLKPDPWTLVDERYEVGQIIDAEVTNVVSFGAFARVDEGLEGLIHISELAEGNFLHPRNVVKEGQQIQACILNIDSANHRLGLSLRQVHNHHQGEPPL
jgi:small subunit ribosomal protein S1